MNNSIAKKVFAVGTAAATVLMSAVPFAAFAAAHSAGTNVSSSDGTVWMITSEGTRRPYTSAGAFLSYGFNSFSSVVPANADDLALPAGSFIPPQDGKVICSDRGADKGTCYLITMGKKAGFTSASVFTGRGFSFSRTTNGDVSWMSSASNISDTTSASPAGVLINDNGTIKLVGANGTMGIPSVAVFNSWGYSFADVVPANAADKALPMSGGVMTTRTPGQLSPVGVTGGNTPVQTGPISASLAADNPASTTVIKGTTGNTLAKFVFNGSGAVTGLSLKRIGVSADTVLSNVYLYDGNTRLTDAASVNTGSVINFTNANGLFTVSGSRTISVRADIDSSATAGQTVGAQLTSITSGSNVSNVTISGNTHTVASVSDLATVDFGTATPSGGSVDPAKDVEVFRSNVSVGTRNVSMSALTIRQIGSVNNSDIANLRLIVDGQTIATAGNINSDGYVVFSFANPVTMQTGTRALRILADVNGGSSRTFHFSIRNKADVMVMDSNYGAYISPTYASGNFPAAPASAVSINSGSLTIQKAAGSPSGDVTNNSSDVALARYTVTAYGEPIKIETIKGAFTSSDASVASLRNGRILVNGAQYGSTATLNSTTTSGTTYTINYTVMPGTPVTLELRADMFDNDGTNNLTANDSVTGQIMAGSSNAQRMTSLGYISVPSSLTSANALTVVTGSMTLTKNSNYANQTTPLPQTAYRIGSFSLGGSSSEDINVDRVGVTVAASSGSTFDYADLSDVMVKVNGNMFGTVKSSLSSGENTFSGSFTLSKNSNATVEVFATLNSGAVTSGNSALTSAIVYGTTQGSSNSIDSGTVAGQIVASGTGTLTATFAAGPSPVAANLLAGTTQNAAVFKFDAANDSFTITEVTATTAAATTITTVNLLDCGSTGASCNSTPIATRPGGATSTTFSGLNIAVAANGTKYLGIQYVLGAVGVGAGTSAENVRVTLASFKYNDSNGVQSTSTPSLLGSSLYVYKATPTISTVALPSTVLSGGTKTLFKYTVGASGNTISWKTTVFTIATSSNITIGSLALYDSTSGLAVGGSFSSTTTSTGLVTAFVATNEQEVSTTKTYELRATVGGTITTGSYVSTSIAQAISSFASPAAYATVHGTNASFVWSDLSAASHSTSTTDWTNDYLVTGIPTASLSLTQ